MKRSRTLSFALSLAALSLPGGAALLLTACGKGAPSPAAAKAAVRYHCPMHPQVVRDQPGDCPICGMRLVPIDEKAHGAETPAAPATAGERKVLFYRSPMDPKVTSPVPEKDEMGMDFVPVYADEVAGGGTGPAGLAPVTIDLREQQLLGLTTVKVERAPLATSIRTVGRVAFDETRLHHVHLRYDAFVEHVEADFTGQHVRKGEVLAQVYSPELYATQQEYLLALKASRSLSGSTIPSVTAGGEDLLAAARKRLLLWDMTPADIDALGRRGEPSRTVAVYAPISGYVMARTAYHGMRVTASDSLFDIVDLSNVWVLADVYEYELPRLALGQRGTVTLSYWPGRSWTGRVTYVYPVVDEKSRTVKVRLELATPRPELKPEMYADVVIQGASREALVVPDDALLDSGTRMIAFVSEGQGRLSPREVTVGEHAKGLYEVKAGLAEGETVARGANFLVDSESRLKAALSAMAPGAGH